MGVVATYYGLVEVPGESFFALLDEDDGSDQFERTPGSGANRRLMPCDVGVYVVTREYQGVVELTVDVLDAAPGDVGPADDSVVQFHSEVGRLFVEVFAAPADSFPHPIVLPSAGAWVARVSFSGQADTPERFDVQLWPA